MIKLSRHDYISLPFVYVLIVIATISLVVISSKPQSLVSGVVAPESNRPRNVFTFNKEAFVGFEVRAKAYIVYDITTGEVIASKNEEAVLTLASITKVMTALSSLLHNNKLSPILINSSSIDGSYDLGLKKDQTWKLNELLKYTLVFSSNDGAYSVADSLGGRNFFVNQMNSDATALGLKLKFTDPAGLDIGTKLGGEGSALETAKLLALTYKRYPDIFDPTTQKRASVISSTGKVSGVPNTNQTINTIIEAEASKTGYTDNAGGNLAVIVDITLGRPVVIVVLGSTKEERFSDVEKLYIALKKSIVF